MWETIMIIGESSKNTPAAPQHHSSTQTPSAASQRNLCYGDTKEHGIKAVGVLDEGNLAIGEEMEIYWRKQQT